MEPDKKRKPESLDYALAALSPAFIMTMIGSLVFFLIAQFYSGQQTGRLMWVLGLYTFATVLIARIAIEQSRAQSFAYMALLGAATLLVITRLFTASGSLAFLSLPFLVLLLLLIAYLADRITFDCTLIHEDISSQGVGLLQSIGLFRKDGEGRRDDLAVANGRKRKHNPGVWVLYFSLLAIPVFGIGQFFMGPSTDRAFAYRMVFVYLFSALSLLVLIALLTLRKYLRERDVPMDVSIAAQWITAGVASAAALVLIFALLPLPSEPLWNWKLPFEIARRDNLQPNPNGMGPDGVAPPTQPDQQPDPGQQRQPGQQGQNPQQGNPADSADPVDPAAQADTGEPAEVADSDTSWQIEWDWSSLFSWLLLVILLLTAFIWGWKQRLALFRFLSEFFSRQTDLQRNDIPSDPVEVTEQLDRFAAYVNPFTASQFHAEQIVQHTFRALIAWGREHRLVRGEEETPDEFVRRVARKYPEQQQALIHLGHLYGRIAYAKSQVLRAEVGSLEELWIWWEASKRQTLPSRPSESDTMDDPSKKSFSPAIRNS